MTSEAYKCSVCGGIMKMITVVANKAGRLNRYKCTCGHCEDIKADPRSDLHEKDALVLDGFEEIP